MLVSTKVATAETMIEFCDSPYCPKSGRESVVIEYARRVVGVATIDHDIDALLLCCLF